MDALPLAGQRIALVGRFASLPQVELAEVIQRLGGAFQHAPSRQTTWVVIGQDGWPLDEEGQPTHDLLRAKRYRALGYPLEFVAEEEFLIRAGLAGDESSVRRRYTLPQLARLLNIPGRRLRAWMRLGLIEPVEVVQRLAFFDFAEVANARRLGELVSAGVPRRRLVESLKALREWLPEADRPLAQLAASSSAGLAFRLPHGQLAESSGQYRFDFDGDPSAPTSIDSLSAKSVDEWFDEGLALEDVERFAEAAQAYGEAIRLDPHDPVLRFNRGNALCAAGELAAAAEELAEATRIDPGYAEAWLNLSNTLADLGRLDEALAAGNSALAALPGYADAHYNLAQLYEEAGRAGEARDHWERYLKLEPKGRAAEEVRRRLGERR